MTNMGILISLSGIDGAGKSTQVKLLSKYLRVKNKKVMSTELMFTYFLLGPVVKHLRRITGSPSGGPVKRNKKNIFAKFWFILAFLDIWIGYIFKVRLMLKKYEFVIADRFYVDIWANLLYYGYLPGWAFTITRFLPKADIQLLFLVEPGTVRKREDDFPKGYYNEQAKIYNRMAKLINFRILDANQQTKTVFAEVKGIINEKI